MTVKCASNEAIESRSRAMSLRSVHITIEYTTTLQRTHSDRHWNLQLQRAVVIRTARSLLLVPTTCRFRTATQYTPATSMRNDTRWIATSIRHRYKTTGQLMCQHKRLKRWSVTDLARSSVHACELVRGSKVIMPLVQNLHKPEYISKIIWAVTFNGSLTHRRHKRAVANNVDRPKSVLADTNVREAVRMH
ncbi:hypothetical protein CLF_107036 [Clonorchis sinensis]|uniref:Uncharacterized protein n=1 Tax=Clonorchis sinensis TaxID=79923 RepID=G7YQC5_CLOSI|nr:hypothetical protein CLF_107036 [Clonorchis sinensis]